MKHDPPVLCRAAQGVGSRFFLLSLVVLLCANLFLLWFGTSRAQGSAPYSAYHRIEESIAGMSMDEMGEFLHGELARVEGIVHVDGVLRSEAYSGGRRDEGLRERYADDFAAYEELYRAGGYLTYAPTLAREYAFLKSKISPPHLMNLPPILSEHSPPLIFSF